jgi:hypothetical protein
VKKRLILSFGKRRTTRPAHTGTRATPAKSRHFVM